MRLAELIPACEAAIAQAVAEGFGRGQAEIRVSMMTRHRPSGVVTRLSYASGPRGAIEPDTAEQVLVDAEHIGWRYVARFNASRVRAFARAFGPVNVDGLRLVADAPRLQRVPLRPAGALRMIAATALVRRQRAVVTAAARRRANEAAGLAPALGGGP